MKCNQCAVIRARQNRKEIYKSLARLLSLPRSLHKCCASYSFREVRSLHRHSAIPGPTLQCLLTSSLYLLLFLLFPRDSMQNVQHTKRSKNLVSTGKFIPRNIYYVCRRLINQDTKHFVFHTVLSTLLNLFKPVFKPLSPSFFCWKFDIIFIEKYQIRIV